MNKTFDLHRFGMVLRWDLLTNRKSYFCMRTPILLAVRQARILVSALPVSATKA